MYAMSLLMEYAAFVKLRLFHKECKPIVILCMPPIEPYPLTMFSHSMFFYSVQRPYRIPLPDWMAVLVVIPPTLGISFVFATSSWYVYFFCTLSLLLGVVLFKLSEISKQRGWFAYASKAANGYNQCDKSPLESDCLISNE